MQDLADYEYGYWSGWEKGKTPPYWNTLRAYVLERDGYTCQRCDEKLRGSALNLHHITPWQSGGVDSQWNLVTVCEPCHDHLHGVEPESNDGIGGDVGEAGAPLVTAKREKRRGEYVCTGLAAPGVLMWNRRETVPFYYRARRVSPDEALASGVYSSFAPSRMGNVYHFHNARKKRR